MELHKKQNASIRMLLAKYGVSQNQLSQILGITPTTVSSKLNVLTPWTVNELKKMADYFSVSVDSLLER